jgi:hypothetical protein
MYIKQRYEHDYSQTAPLAQGPLAAIAGVLSAVGSIVSTGISFMGAQQQASAAKQAAVQAQISAEYNAKQLESKAQQERAASQRTALETVRKGELTQSMLINRAAASGAGTTDESVLSLGEQIAGRSEYDRLADMFRGEDMARGLEDQAKAARYEGATTAQGYRAQAQAYKLQGAATLASGASSFFTKYARDLPSFKPTDTFAMQAAPATSIAAANRDYGFGSIF